MTAHELLRAAPPALQAQLQRRCKWRLMRAGRLPLRCIHGPKLADVVAVCGLFAFANITPSQLPLVVPTIYRTRTLARRLVYCNQYSVSARAGVLRGQRA